MAAVLLAVAAAGWSRSGAFEDPCAHPERQLSGVWDEGVEGRLRAAFLGTGRSYAADTAARTAALLDGYGTSWAAMRREVCVATVKRKQPREVLALRDGCLLRLRGQLRALTGLFADKPDPEILDKAVTAAASLPPIAYCADSEALAARVPPPEDPALRARVASLQPEVDRMSALRSAGKYREALAIGEPLLAETEAIDFPPLRAQVQIGMGTLRDLTGDYPGAQALLRAGGVSAAEGRDDVLAAQAAARLLLVVGYRQRHFEEAPALLQMGRIVLTRARDNQTWGDWWSYEGLVLEEMRQYAEAHAAFDRAVAMDTNIFGPDHPDVARVLANQAGVYHFQHDLPRAKAGFERALATLEKALGPDHPDVARTHYDRAMVLQDMGDLPGAVAMNERALAGKERALGPDHPEVAYSLTNLAGVLQETGELPRARSLLERALAIKEKTLAPDNPALGVTVDSLGVIAYALGELPQAKALFERALAIWEKGRGADHPDVAYALVGLGRTLVRLGRIQAASPLLERALAVREKAQGGADPDLADPLLGLGELRLARHEPAQAVPLLERALIVEPTKPDPDALLALAEALWQIGKDRPRALSRREVSRELRARRAPGRDRLHRALAGRAPAGPLSR